MSVVKVSDVTDFAALGERWRDLEERAHGSFFQSWSWVGCLVAERFPRPILVEVTESGRTVALALFNQTRSRIGSSILHLGESGNAEFDCPYVEQNGVLAEAGREGELTERCLRAVATSHDLVLSGIGDAVRFAAQRAAGLMSVIRTQDSPFVDLAALRSSGDDYLAGRSANTRQQLRRSDRFYEREGRIALERAGSAAQAHHLLDEMATLHQQSWIARGRAGSFARPFFRRFIEALIDAAVARGEVALLKVSSGARVVGILCNFVYRGRMLAYQSGFAYRPYGAQAKPGLTCHHQAIRLALDQGLEVYDFLAGDSRYKRSLTDRSHRQSWVDAGPLWSPRLLLRNGVRLFQ